MVKKENKLINWMLILSLVAIAISSYLLYLHYSSESSSFCDISNYPFRLFKFLQCDDACEKRHPPDRL